MIYSTFQKRPHLSRLLLGLVLVLGVVELALAITDSFPGRYDWVLGCLLFATILVWTGASALAGAIAPVGRTAMRFAYGVLAILFLVFVASVFAHPVIYLYFDTDLDWLDIFSPHIALTLWAWMALAGLAGALAPRDIGARAYIPLVTTPLVLGICVMGYLFLDGGYAFLDTSLSHQSWMRYIQIALYGFYGLPVLLLFRAFLLRLTWTDRLRSNLLFIPVVVATVALTALNLGTLVLIADPRAAAVFGLVILIPFGIVTSGSKRSGQYGERQLRHTEVSTAALGIAMASYWIIVIVAIAVGYGFLSAGISTVFFFPLVGGLIVSVPAGYLISEMRHPHRNVFVAAIGPGLLMLMIMCVYWFDVLDQGF